jgi:hypothetical protein
VLAAHDRCAAKKRTAMIATLQFVMGSLSLAGASFVYWRVGQPAGLSARWRSFPAMDLIIVTIVLGGWTAGACLVIYAIINAFS